MRYKLDIPVLGGRMGSHDPLATIFAPIFFQACRKCDGNGMTGLDAGIGNTAIPETFFQTGLFGIVKDPTIFVWGTLTAQRSVKFFGIICPFLVMRTILPVSRLHYTRKWLCCMLEIVREASGSL